MTLDAHFQSRYTAPTRRWRRRAREDEVAGERGLHRDFGGFLISDLAYRWHRGPAEDARSPLAKVMPAKALIWIWLSRRRCTRPGLRCHHVGFVRSSSFSAAYSVWSCRTPWDR